MTSSDTAVGLVRRYYAAINARDWSGYDELFTPDTELAAPGTEEDGFVRLRGIDAVRGFDQIWSTAAEDFTVEPLETMADADGSVVLSRNAIALTHTGTLHTPMGDVPATGARIETTYVGSFRVHGGRIVSQQVYYDQLALALRLGMVPTPA
jgi:ketosteroid isomerase-like protein